MTYVGGLDLSLTGTGIARIRSTGLDGYGGATVNPDVTHCRIGSDTAGRDVHARARRLETMADAITLQLAIPGRPDLVLVEEPPAGMSGGSAHDRSGLWWLVMSRLIRHGVPCAEVNVSHLKMYALGAGKGTKDQVVAETVRRYAAVAPTLSTNDEADALVLAALAWHHVTGTPLVPLPQTHTRTLDRIRWPSTTTERGHRA